MVRDQRFLGIGFLVLGLVSIPYIYAFSSGSPDWVFGGFLLNPIDGYTYLAKMQQGYAGSWRFTLPFTAEPGKGAYLFLLYVSLGQAARMLDLPLLSVFHLARIVSSVVLLYALWQLASKLFGSGLKLVIGYLICVLGSGLGWAFVTAGVFSSDFWVAEAYPFLSMYANPHFALGLGLFILALLQQKGSWLASGLTGLLLALIQPFLAVVLIIVKAGSYLLEFRNIRPRNLGELLSSAVLWDLIGSGLGAGIPLLYQYLAIIGDPVLAAWNSQNQTPPPGLTDWLISFSPALLLAGFGLKEAWQKEPGRRIVIWALACAVLSWIPWHLQRRFLTGFYVPLALLAVMGLDTAAKALRIQFKTAAAILLVLVIPTNLIVLLSGLQAAARHDPGVYIASDLVQGMSWIREHTESESLILADEEAGLLIPAETGRRVIYGHPFETAGASEQRQLVREIFSGKIPAAEVEAWIAERGIGYLLARGDQRELSAIRYLEQKYPAVYQNPSLVIYKLDLP